MDTRTAPEEKEKNLTNDQKPCGEGIECASCCCGTGEDQGEIEELREELALMTQKADENYNRLLRLAADFDNFKKRAHKEREEEHRFWAEKFVVNILPVLDNLERALSAKGEQEQSVLTGVEMIYRQLLEVLAREGLAPVPALGRQFDPSMHEAVAQEANADRADNEVVEELRKGYFLNGKVVRPSMVKVCRNS